MNKYSCPMHPEITSNRLGKCPKCGMDLVLKSEMNKPEKDSYKPLLIIAGLILLISLIISLREFINGSFSIVKFISYFMSGFFITFAGFKLLDLKGFEEGFKTYDLYAQKNHAYGLVYPFIELSFGLGMILAPQSKLLLLLEIGLMTFSGLGVLVKLMKKEKFRCVCLGTAFKLPLTQVTLIEDFGMAFLALILIIQKV